MPASGSVFPRRLVLVGLLCIVIVAAFTLRTWNINFDQGTGSHPDERSTACFYATTIHLPDSWEELRDPRRSPLNPLWDSVRQEPRRFTYGHFPLYLGVATGDILHSLAPVAAPLGLSPASIAIMEAADRSCNAIAVAGRLVIALLDTLTVLLLFYLGRRIYGEWAGLLAATFYALAAQAIQLSHFFAMDPASTTFTVLAILGAIRMFQTRGLGAAILCGLGAGLAISSKFSALPILLSPIVAAGFIQWDVAQQRVEGGAPPDEYPARARLHTLVAPLLSLAVAGFAFAVTSPYAILDWRNFIQATLIEQGLMVRGVTDFPFTRQYRNTIPYLYFMEQQLRWGLGWPLGLAAAAGTLAALWTLLRGGYAMVATAASSLLGRSRWHVLSRQEMAILIVWSWLVPYFGLTGAFLAKFNRYMSPVLPFVLLFAAGLAWQLWRWAGMRTPPSPSAPSEQAEEGEGMPMVAPASQGTTAAGAARLLARVAAVALVLMGIVGGLFWSLAYVNGVYGREHTWIAASRWIYQNAPPGSTILWELWDDPLPKAIPGEPGMDMSSARLRNIDWSPYEEDTAEKYAILVDKLREADYVVYSSKRIYDSVDELPQRYPMTNLYYQSMWDGSLGFELAHEESSPPRLFGLEFDDRHADESWSLYDHPQVSIFRKVRDLTDAEFAAVLAGSWSGAIPHYRGGDSPLEPLLALVGLGSRPDSRDQGLINRALALLRGDPSAEQGKPEDRTSLESDIPLDQLPVVDNYRWNRVASDNALLAVVWWWLVLSLVGWLAWPFAFYLFRPLRDRGYLVSKVLGWLLCGWLLWYLASYGLLANTVRNAWLVTCAVGAVGAGMAWMQASDLLQFMRRSWRLLLWGEALFAVAYLFFVVIRMANPDLWQPWFGGEKFMEFAFLNGILRSPGFPPIDPHFAGGVINYYYFGIYLVAFLVKLTGVYAEVAFNLAIPTLFALTVTMSFAIAYSCVNLVRWKRSSAIAPAPSGQSAGREQIAAESGVPPAEPGPAWHVGLGEALLAPLLVVIIGNLDGFAQIVRSFAEVGATTFRSTLPGLQTLVAAAAGLGQTLTLGKALPPYDFWGPSRVIPYSINEFPYWSFLYADLHPHLIGIPFALLFVGLLLVLLFLGADGTRLRWGQGFGLLALAGLMLGTLAAVNLWELPTYFGVGILALIVSLHFARGRISWRFALGATLLFPVVAYVAFLPFFRRYTNVGASGIGFVREGDSPGMWLLIWGFFLLILIGWLWNVAARQPLPRRNPTGASEPIRPTGIERVISLGVLGFERLPRIIYLHRILVRYPTVFYELGVLLLPLSLLAALGSALWGRWVLALCLFLLGPAFLLLWRRGLGVDPGDLLATLLTAVGLAILAGTQLVFLRDFLQGGDWYRMNTLFKFFNQVWVMWGIAAAVALPRLWRRWVRMPRQQSGPEPELPPRWVRLGWALLVVVTLVISLAYPLLGTPARLDQRFAGWRPAFGTLNGLDFMRQGTYTWPDGRNTIELSHDWEAIQWLLSNVAGNPVIVESSHVDYYRAGGTRVASLTGLSGLRGMHESEQRYSSDLAERDRLHQELWDTPDPARTMEIIRDLDVALIYVGQLERLQHPEGVEKLEKMAGDGLLVPLFSNERVTIYSVPGSLVQTEQGMYIPS